MSIKLISKVKEKEKRKPHRLPSRRIVGADGRYIYITINLE